MLRKPVALFAHEARAAVIVMNFSFSRSKNGLPSSRTRFPTPSLLFGRYAISAPEKLKMMSRLALGRTTSRPGSRQASNGFLPVYAYPASWNPEVPSPTMRGVDVSSLALQPA